MSTTKKPISLQYGRTDRFIEEFLRAELEGALKKPRYDRSCQIAGNLCFESWSVVLSWLDMPTPFATACELAAKRMRNLETNERKL